MPPEQSLEATESSTRRRDALTTSFDGKVLKACCEHFRSLDTDLDGRLSLQEFRHGLGLLGVDPLLSGMMFNAYDRDGNGAIDMREFIACLSVQLGDDEAEQIGLVRASTARCTKVE